MQKFVLLVIIPAVVALTGVASYVILNQLFTPTTTTQESTKNYPVNDGFVMLEQEFTIKKAETATLQGSNVSLKITDFIYSPCPTGAQCVWSGLGIFLELTVDGTVYKSIGHSGKMPPEAPYEVLLKKTDYQTYATFVISKR